MKLIRERSVYLMNEIRKFNDRLNHKDKLDVNNSVKRFKHPSPFARTQVIIRNELGEILDIQENQVVLGGALFVLEKCWKVNSPLPIDDLNTIMSIANTGATPDPDDVKVCLFGVGTGGSGDAIGTVVDVNFYEREIFDMVPLRVTEPANMTAEELTKYFFMEDQGDGKTRYYLKTFENTPEIKVLWKDAGEGEDGSEVTTGVHNTTRTEPIETFVEMTLKITNKDLREWFEQNGEVELTRFNSIGLFTGAPTLLGDGVTTDYKDVKMISKLNIDNEMLTFSKELTITYRIYTS